MRMVKTLRLRVFGVFVMILKAKRDFREATKQQEQSSTQDECAELEVVFKPESYSLDKGLVVSGKGSGPYQRLSYSAAIDYDSANCLDATAICQLEILKDGLTVSRFDCGWLLESPDPKVTQFTKEVVAAHRQERARDEIARRLGKSQKSCDRDRER